MYEVAEIDESEKNGQGEIAAPQLELRKRDARLIQIVDAALADAAERAQEHLVCRPGCTQCCHGAFAINALDAARLREGSAGLAESDPERAAGVRARASKFLSEYGAGFPGDQATGILGTTAEEQEAFEEFANEVACPALDPATGNCDLYTARPMTCRVFGPPVRMDFDKGAEEETGFAVCDLCFTDASPSEVEACEMHLPRELEESLLTDFEHNAATASGETIVAYCLVDRDDDSLSLEMVAS